MIEKDHLYIIGNGFDLYHGLSTSFDDFKDYVKRNNQRLYDIIDRYFTIKNFWHCFEENLAKIDLDVLRQHGEVYLEDYGANNWRDSFHHDYQFEIGRIVDAIVDDLYICFVNWLSQIDVYNAKSKNILLLKDAIYLTFNYTQTLETVYDIPYNNILHIHGRYNKKLQEKMIYGHGGVNFRIEKDDDIRITEGEEIISGYYTKTTKPIKMIINKYRKFFYKRVSYVKHVTIIGHSMSKIDYPYFKRLVNSFKHKVDYVFYFHSTSDIYNCIYTFNCRLKVPLKRLTFLPYPD